MSFLAEIASMLPGKVRGVKWAEAMKEIAAADAAKKAAKEAEERAEAAFLALSADEQVELVHAAWVVNATPEPVRAKEALVAGLLPWAEANLVPKDDVPAMELEVLPKKKKKVVFGDPMTKEVPVCLLQSSDTTWKFNKAKFGPDMDDVEYPVAPPLALLRAVRLAEKLSREL